MLIKLLTDRQAEVLRLLCAGNRDQEVADQLGIALASVRNHMAAIRSRTRQRSIPDICQTVAEEQAAADAKRAALVSAR
jgi:DNA-binding CsgD family transcriptional regulator